MSMSKKDFIAMAQQVASALAGTPAPVERRAMYKVVDRMTNAMAQANSLFQWSTFMAACGFTEEDKS